VPVIGLVMGLILAFGLPATWSPLWVRIIGYVLLAISALIAISVFYELKRPRLAYGNGKLQVYLRPGPPVNVPIELVEGFLMGQGPSMLPGQKFEQAETTTVVVKLADSAEEFSHIDVKPQYGKWCDSYITIRGTWSEPLNVALVQRLNQRLYEVTRDAKTNVAENAS
jgi:hypothetical protein